MTMEQEFEKLFAVPKPQTNFDRITQSEEVLANWLNKFVCFPCELCKHWNSRCEFYAQGKRYCAVQTEEDEDNVWLEWLKQESDK